MTNREKILRIVQETIQGTQATGNYEVDRALAELIVRDLFSEKNVKVVSDYQEELEIERYAPSALKKG